VKTRIGICEGGVFSAPKAPSTSWQPKAQSPPFIMTCRVWVAAEGALFDQVAIEGGQVEVGVVVLGVDVGLVAAVVEADGGEGGSVLVEVGELGAVGCRDNCFLGSMSLSPKPLPRSTDSVPVSAHTRRSARLRHQSPTS
jgi:hypothetical protein